MAFPNFRFVRMVRRGLSDSWRGSLKNRLGRHTATSAAIRGLVGGERRAARPSGVPPGSRLRCSPVPRPPCGRPRVSRVVASAGRSSRSLVRRLADSRLASLAVHAFGAAFFGRGSIRLPARPTSRAGQFSGPTLGASEAFPWNL